MVWYGVVRYGVVWCGMVWYGVVWCDMGWCGVVWCGVVWCGVCVFTYSFNLTNSLLLASRQSSYKGPPVATARPDLAVCTPVTVLRDEYAAPAAGSLTPRQPGPEGHYLRSAESRPT